MTQRTLAILLVISVAVNVFVLGAVASWAWQREAGPRHRRPPFGTLERPGAEGRHMDFGSWLSDAERAELRPRRRAIRELRREVESHLRAEPFEPEKLRASLEAMRAETAAIQAPLHETLVRRASSLDAAERRRLAEARWLGGPPRGRRPRRD